MRLDRFLSNNLNISRSQASQWIKGGLVTVNGATATSGALNLPENAQVTARGEPVSACGPLYLMLHKPAGFVCANTDGNHPTVLDLLPQKLLGRYRDIQIAGRLDVDTTGLVLITSDGQWNHRMTAPGRSTGKTYRVTLAEPISQEAIALLEQGLMLRGEDKPTLPCTIQLLDDHCVNITLHEGRYHQVKRMFATVGNRVTALHRWRVGQLELGDLAAGEYRELSADEAAL